MKRKVYSVVIEVSESETVVRSFLTEKEAQNFLHEAVVAELKAAKEMGKIVSFNADTKAVIAAEGYYTMWDDDVFSYHMCMGYDEDHYYIQVYEDEVEVPYMLIFTDGYSIEVQYFADAHTAEEEMARRYNELLSACGDDFKEGNDFYDMSYLSDTEALLYTNGDNVYCMKIVSTVKED